MRSNAACSAALPAEAAISKTRLAMAKAKLKSKSKDKSKARKPDREPLRKLVEAARAKKAAKIFGREHWTDKVDGGERVKLFLWEKYAGDPKNAHSIVLFVHGSSMASRPTFDLKVSGR